ncbi:hypothetical protein ACLOAV_005717 [Pseudogymnoascus australis]
MRVLCLHGRGSNNEIFQMQTASFRADLDDFEWEFVGGTTLHTEGNWSLHTAAFSNLPLYSYYNPLSPSSIIEAENDILRITEEEGPFDGVLGYSGGAALASQIIIRDAIAHPFKSPNEFPFRFAIFINGASPLRAFRLSGPADCLGDGTTNPEDLIKEAEGMFLRASATRKKNGVNDEDQPDREAMLRALASFKGHVLDDGTPFLTDGEYGLTRWNARTEIVKDKGEILISIPTLHIRNPAEEDMHHGEHLLTMCEPGLRREYHHGYGHDFPRGRREMKKIAELIRETAERA